MKLTGLVAGLMSRVSIPGGLFLTGVLASRAMF